MLIIVCLCVCGWVCKCIRACMHACLCKHVHNAHTYTDKHLLFWDVFLPTSLVVFQQDTCRHLDWLKNVKESHGSVEVNAISQAKAINARGIYHVGKLKDLEPEVD